MTIRYYAALVLAHVALFGLAAYQQLGNSFLGACVGFIFGNLSAGFALAIETAKD